MMATSHPMQDSHFSLPPSQKQLWEKLQNFQVKNHVHFVLDYPQSRKRVQQGLESIDAQL